MILAKKVRNIFMGQTIVMVFPKYRSNIYAFHMFLLTSWKKADTKKTAMAALIFEMPLLSMGLYKCLKQIQIITLMF